MRYSLELVAIAVVTLFVLTFAVQYFARPGADPERGPDWAGTDESVTGIIEGTGYTPWISPVWEPPSGEIETFLFTVQAAAGALVVGYFFGYYRGMKRSE